MPHRHRLRDPGDPNGQAQEYEHERAERLKESSPTTTRRMVGPSGLNGTEPVQPDESDKTQPS